jgi:hypothetical protein
VQGSDGGFEGGGENCRGRPVLEYRMGTQEKEGY